MKAGVCGETSSAPGDTPSKVYTPSLGYIEDKIAQEQRAVLSEKYWWAGHFPWSDTPNLSQSAR